MPECPSGKLIYTCPHDAIRALNHIRKRHRRSQGPIESTYYRCPTCRQYHLKRRDARQPRA